MAKIIVIDDDDQLLHMVGLMLERGGHNITLISNPRDGLERIKAHKPDLLVLDVMMPGMSGHDLTRQIRETSGLEGLPILILTARSQDIDRDTALKIGANAYLSKPVTSQELIKQIDTLLTPKVDEKAAPGMILSLFGLRGGVGQTTLATNLALALRRVSQHEVCLVDLSLAVGQTPFHLHLKPQSSWADLMGSNTFDWPMVKEHLAIHPTGLRLLPAPAMPQTSDGLPAYFIIQLIELLRSRMMFTVLDLPPILCPAFMAALEMTDVGLHVISPDVISVRTAVQANRALVNSGIKLKQKSFILNQVSAKPQLSKATVERVLNGRIPFHIDFDPNQMQALTQGTPLALTGTNSPIPTIINRMAEVIWNRAQKARG